MEAAPQDRQVSLYGIPPSEPVPAVPGPKMPEAVPEKAQAKTIRVVCPSCSGGNPACSCRGTGVLDVSLLRPPPHAVTPCCGAAWRASPDPHGWRCSRCPAVYDRVKVAGW